jgi:hypothetical protein
VRDSEIDKPRFLHAGDDLDFMAEDLLCRDQKLVGVPGLAQGVGTDDPHLTGIHIANSFAESTQAIQRAVDQISLQAAAAIETRGQANHLSEAIDDDELAVPETADNHVKAIRAEIDGCDDFGGLRIRGAAN